MFKAMECGGVCVGERERTGRAMRERGRERELYTFHLSTVSRSVSFAIQRLTTFQFHTSRAELNLQALSTLYTMKIRIC